MPIFRIVDERHSALRNEVTITSCLSDGNRIVLEGFVDGAVKQGIVGEHGELIYFDYGPVLLLLWDISQYAVLSGYNYTVSVDERSEEVYILDDQRLLKSSDKRLEVNEIPPHIWFETNSTSSDTERLKKLVEYCYGGTSVLAGAEPLVLKDLEPVRQKT